jgi:hypothetical protein
MRRLFLITDMGEIEIAPLFWPNLNWTDGRWSWRVVNG